MNTYVVKYRFELENLSELIGMSGGGAAALTGDNVKVVGAWNLIGPRRGFAVIEAEQLQDLARFLEQWVNHLDMEVSPVKPAMEIWK
jgi:hypothetical protein